MTTQDSESELAGRLGASLTPRVPRIVTQHRGEQSSGLFDIGALYAASVEQVMRRARVTREQPPVFGIAGVARPVQVGLPSAWVAAPALVEDEEIDLERLFNVRAHGVGWFGVAVAWLATTALGATIATTVPAHTVARGHAPAVAATAPVVVPLPSPAPPAPPVISSPLATATPVAVTPAPAVVPKKAIGATHPHARPAAPAAPADVTAVAPLAQKVAPESPPAAKAAAPSSSPAAGGASLEDLMRRAVEADSKRR